MLESGIHGQNWPKILAFDILQIVCCGGLFGGKMCVELV